MVVNLDTPAQMAELMYVLAWFVGEEPRSLRSCRRRFMARQSPTRSGLFERELIKARTDEGRKRSRVTTPAWPSMGEGRRVARRESFADSV